MGISRRRFLQATGGAALLGAVGLLPSLDRTPGLTDPADHRNILLIVADDLRADFGGVDVPNIWSIGEVHTGQCTYPLCAPSRASMLTGLPLSGHGVRDNRTPLPRDVLTLPEHLARHGYTTASVGKVAHHATTDRIWNHSVRTPGGTVHADGGDFRCRLYERLDVPDETYLDWHRTTACVGFMDTLHSPWFMAVGFLAPHPPFCAPARYWDSDPVSLDGVGSHTVDWLAKHGYAGRTVDAETATAVIRGYRAGVRFLDAQVGRLLDAVPQGTRVILVSDNGFALGEGGSWSKFGTAPDRCWDVPIAGAPWLADLTGLFPHICRVAHVPVPPLG